jgi:23S rRNA (uracil1939-C5)-methyltransferase
MMKDTLWRGARIEQNLVWPVIPSSLHYTYRRRIQLKLHFSAGKQFIGFYRPGSHYVVDINDSCLLAHESINAVLPFIRTVVMTCNEPDKIPQVDLSSSENGDVAAVFHYIGSDINQFSASLRALTSNAGNLQTLAIQTGRKNSFKILSEKQTLHYSLPSANGDIALQFAPDGFSQVNFQQNRALATFISDLCATIKPDNVLDLYCGNGNFSLPLATMVKSISGFESFEKSVALANNNAMTNGLYNAKYYCLDSSAAVEKLAQEGQLFDLVIIDPPRNGAADVAANIYKTGATSVIYVSCDPMTLARDISILQRTGYKVVQVQPFDMFPQTCHIENVVHLTVNQ